MGRKELDTNIVLDAASRLFLKNGFSATTMTEIASASNITKRTLYKYFSSKEDVFDIIIEKIFNQLLEIKLPKLDNDLSAQDKISILVSELVTIYTSEEFFRTSKIIMSEVLHGKTFNSKHMEQYADFEEKIYHFLKRNFNSELKNSEFDSKFLGNYLIVMIKGFIFYPLLYGVESLSEKEISKLSQKIEVAFLKLVI